MNGLHSLQRDHADIATMLRVLAAGVERLQQRQYVDPEMLAGIDRFLQQFLLECHFHKEEAIFFPAVQAALPDQADTVLACRALHARCLKPLTAFHRVVEQIRTGDIQARVDAFTAAAGACLECVGAALAAEQALLDRCRRLPARGADDQLARYAEVERRHLGAAGREWFAQLVSDYADITSTWHQWPAVAGAPGINSGRAPRRRSGDAPSVPSGHGRTTPRGARQEN